MNKRFRNSGATLRTYAGNALVVGVVSAIAIPVALACASPYAAIESAVDWADVITGIAAIAALVAGVLVVKRGARMLLSMIGR